MTDATPPMPHPDDIAALPGVPADVVADLEMMALSASGGGHKPAWVADLAREIAEKYVLTPRRHPEIEWDATLAERVMVSDLIACGYDPEDAAATVGSPPWRASSTATRARTAATQALREVAAVLGGAIFVSSYQGTAASRIGREACEAIAQDAALAALAALHAAGYVIAPREPDDATLDRIAQVIAETQCTADGWPVCGAYEVYDAALGIGDVQ